jgi:hypothetical protein
MMQQLPPGAMVAVALSEQELRPLIGDGLDIGAINGPKHTTVAGSHEAMEPFKRRLDQQRIPYKVIHVPHGYHSRMMDPIIHPYREVVASVNFQSPELDFFSSLLGARATTAELSSPDYWHGKRAKRSDFLRPSKLWRLLRRGFFSRSGRASSSPSSSGRIQAFRRRTLFFRHVRARGRRCLKRPSHLGPLVAFGFQVSRSIGQAFTGGSARGVLHCPATRSIASDTGSSAGAQILT